MDQPQLDLLKQVLTGSGEFYTLRDEMIADFYADNESKVGLIQSLEIVLTQPNQVSQFHQVRVDN